LGQIIYGVHSDEVRRKLLQEGATLSLKNALTTLRTAEATLMQAANLRKNDPPSIQQIKNNTAKTDPKPAARSPHPAFNATSGVAHQQVPHHRDVGTAELIRSTQSLNAQPMEKNVAAVA
jgi:hypothetical protein